MGQQDMNRALDAWQCQAQVANPGAGVEDQGAAIGQRDLDAGGVAAVVHGLGPGSGHGSPCAPDLDSHQTSLCSVTPAVASGCSFSVNGQKITIAPLEPSGPTIGIALAAMSWWTLPATQIRKLPCAGW